MLTYLVVYKKTIFYDVKESISKVKDLMLMLLQLSRKWNVNCVCYESIWCPKSWGKILILIGKKLLTLSAANQTLFLNKY